VLPSKRRRTPPAAPSWTHGAESASPPWPVGWSRGCSSCERPPARDWSCRAPASLTRQQRRADWPYSMQLGHAGRRLGLPRRARAFVDASERRRVSASDARSGRHAVVRASDELAPAFRGGASVSAQGTGELPSTTGSHPTHRPCIRRCGPRGTPKRPASRRNSTGVRPRNSTRPPRSSSPRPPPTATAPRAGSTRASSRSSTGRPERAHAARHDRGHRGADRPRLAPHGEGRRPTSISANATTTMRPRRSCATAPERRRARGGVGDDGRCVRGACGRRGRMDFSRPLRQALW
jgi:hypothetical protein